MDLLEQPDVKKTYEKCKYIVKVWEHKFTKKHKRLPSKLDIREASKEVRHAYRKYFQLKTAALEQSFLDVDGFDEEEENCKRSNEIPEEAHLNEYHNSLIQDNECNDLNTESTTNNSVCDSSELTKSVCDEQSFTESNNSPYGVWGSHLNKNIDIDTSEKLSNEKPNLNLNITKKLFCGSKFTKRNPRKSLSFFQKTKSDVGVDSPCSLSQPILTSKSFTTFNSEDAIFLSQNENSVKNDIFQIITPLGTVKSQSVSIIQNFLQNEHTRPLKSVDPGWLERVADKTETSIENPDLPLPSQSNIIPSNFITMDNNIATTVSEYTKINYDSDDIIEDSDEDTDIEQLHIAKKRKIESIFSVPNNHSEGSKELQTCVNTTHSELVVLNSTKKMNYVNITADNGIELREENARKNEKNTIDKNKSYQGNMISPQMQVISEDKKEKPSTKRNPPKCRLKTSLSKQSNPSISKIHASKRSMLESTSKKQKFNNVEEISPRRSSRQTRVKVSLQEFPSDEEDPFHTDTDENDPEFSVGSGKKKISYQLDTKETILPEKKARKYKSPTVPPNKPKSKRKTKGNSDGTDEENEDKPYELEFTVKPRIVAPRYSNLKKVLTENKIIPKGENILTTDEMDNSVNSSVLKDKRQQAKENLEKKIATGNLNDNFVRINLKKKVFVRGKNGRSFSKYKKAQWKSKKAKALSGPEMDMGGCDGGMLTCFNCGQIGHFAQHCNALKGDVLLPKSAAEEEACPIPTLEEASQMAKESLFGIRKSKLPSENPLSQSEKDGNLKTKQDDYNFDDELDSEQLLLEETLRLEEHVKKLDVRLYMDEVKLVKPFYELNENSTIIDTPEEVHAALHKFGYSSFRPGQEQAIMRILSGKSTLVTLSTGSGKSLCYQLPAYIYSLREPCISLVISPLVSLMDDQVTGLPKFLKAACLHSNQTKSQREKILEAISLGELNILLISPEAVVAGEKKRGFGSLLRKLPPIAFACIDEAHCVSQWSHNFRPSYLMICRVLRESLGVKTILGLTATATMATRDSIVDHLKIPDGQEGVISDIPLPENLILTVSKDALRDHALLGLLMSDRFSICKSIIIYCTRRDECERIAAFLRTSLKSERFVEETDKKRKRLNLQAEPYHAGLSASRRRSIQNKFMSGELRIVVATVAFGMGINKSDIRAVIHFNMPNSFESYVQEVGRAGRDGLKAQCHVFLDSQGRDENELLRHIHANSIDRHVIRKLLQKIFIPCSCKGDCPKHEVAFSIENTVRALDLPEENISTLLCYLELHENKYIELLSPAYTMCKVISYGGPLQIRKASKDCPPLAMALALHKNQVGDDPNVLEFPVVDVAAAMGWESGICKHKLKNLEWTTVNNQPKRSAISVQFSNLGFRLFAPGNLPPDQLDEALDNLYQRVNDQEQKAILQLHAVHNTLLEVAKPSYRTCISEEGDSLIKSKIREYFNSPNPLKCVVEMKPKEINEEQIVSDTRALICMYKDNTFTGRAVARIFHGIQSPNYPAVIWGRCKYWRCHLDVDFHAIVKISTREIIKMR